MIIRVAELSNNLHKKFCSLVLSVGGTAPAELLGFEPALGRLGQDCGSWTCLAS